MNSCLKFSCHKWGSGGSLVPMNMKKQILGHTSEKKLPCQPYNKRKSKGCGERNSEIGSMPISINYTHTNKI